MAWVCTQAHKFEGYAKRFAMRFFSVFSVCVLVGNIQVANSAALPLDGVVQDGSQRSSSGVTCSLQSLKGTYLFELSYSGPNGDRQEQSGIEYYDGNGNVTGRASAKILPDQLYSNFTYTQNYQVGENCSGSITNKYGKTADIFVSPDGNYYTQILTLKGYQGSGSVTRVTKRLVNGLMPMGVK